MLNIIKNIPNVNVYPLVYVFEHMKLKHKPNTLWLEFGTASGRTINYISQFTNDKVYGFDSFEGLPEKWRDGFDKGAFSNNGNLPYVNTNVELIKGWFNETLVNFIQTHNKKVSFIHMDADLYSSTKYVLDILKEHIDEQCIIIFDELVNYPGFDGNTGELKAFYEFITENNVDYEWIGMNGPLNGDSDGWHQPVALKINSIKAKICFITAIYGNYEASCKKYVKQSVPTDFFCFTDNEKIENNGWKIITFPYHLNNNPNDKSHYHNSFNNNKHTFNIAKYYKQSFNNIPILKDYDVVVWVDGTIEIIYEKTSEYILSKIYDNKIIGWNHELRNGQLINEVKESSGYFVYNSTFWNNQSQPFQDVMKQYNTYINYGYSDKYFKNINSSNPNFGIWITCFVAFLLKDDNIKYFLDQWYLQTLQYTTQDQISFPFICQKLNMIPYTLPNEDILGDRPHSNTQFYIKHIHGK